MKQLVIIPAYNEARMIGKVIKKMRLIQPAIDVLVVDDGSTDNTADMASQEGAVVVKHFLNRGLGGAIGTGLEYAKRHSYDLAVTFDADGQHAPKDLFACFNLLSQGNADVVVGNRFKGMNSIPTDRIVINFLANITTFMLFGVWTSDSQSGFRGFNRRAIEGIVLKTDRMEVSSEIFSEIARLGLRYSEMPIQVRYTTYSRYKGQKNSNAWPIFGRLVLRLFR
jgi:UDP-N-acetylglucosamine---dolichyl-phosphate N-acetylglucosaminyltransferase